LSEWNASIVPLDDWPCRGKGPALIAHLQAVGLIDGFYEEQYGWYAGGEGPGYPNVRFEFLQVYDSEHAYFIPSGTTGRYGASCPVCGNDLDQTIYRLRDKWPESHQPADMAGLTVPCRRCGVRTLLKDLPFEIDTAMTRFFVMLDGGEPEERDREFVPAIEKVLGCRTRIVMERM
jgi:hypothetical protein